MEIGITVLVMWSAWGYVMFVVTPHPKNDLAMLAKAIACGPVIWCRMRVSVGKRS